ncbi:MAG: hypothetical protein GY743_24245, partial [Planctomycetaceae bacterium]|nr:hypothetical protein [Planctomycetaceae bacterium]
MTNPLSPTKALDTGFLIGLYLAGGEEALDTITDVIDGDTIITERILEELPNIANKNIPRPQLEAIVDWVRGNSKIDILSYEDTFSRPFLAARKSAEAALVDAQIALDNLLGSGTPSEINEARAGVVSAESTLDAARASAKTALDDAGERGLMELTSGKQVRIELLDPKLGNQFVLGDAAEGVQEAFDDAGASRGPTVLLTNDNSARKALSRSAGGFDFSKFGLVEGPVNNSDWTYVLSEKGFDTTKIKQWNYVLENNPDVGLSPKAQDKLLTSAQLDDIETNRVETSKILQDVGVDADAIPWYKSVKFIAFVKIASKFGLAASIIALSTTAAAAEKLRDEEKESEANELWTKYIFETAGGFVTGLTVLLVANKLFPTPNPYIFAAKLVASVAAGIGGSFAGAYLGELVYGINQEEIDKQFAEIYERIDNILEADADELSEILAGFFGFDLTTVEGTPEADLLFADQYEERNGADGDDTILGFKAEFIAAGASIKPDDPDSELAETDLRMVLDGGVGDDILIALGGTGAILVGGEGRDFLFNTSFKGQMYGDTIDGVGQSTSGTTDSDVFWYWPSTFIMDAQPNDILQMFGWPLLGGSNSVAGIYA